MKKYLSLILTIIICYISFWNNQVSALMSCHTWNPNIFGNDIVSMKQVDCCDFYPQHNPSCNFELGSCKMGNNCTLMDETECNSEWWTFYSGTNCTCLLYTSPSPRD